ncbi:ABC transporter permease [Streptosporangium sp. NPDC051023]|uniref:ABC transporter permease n=1 Tax=Streptosporangium sp. NPDC051023 TaxID=3155410 RepID=UPI00344FCF75
MTVPTPAASPEKASGPQTASGAGPGLEGRTAPGAGPGPGGPTARAGWGRWLLRRMAYGVTAIWATSAVVFAATQALPSDPAMAILGRDATPESLARLRLELGLDRPLWQQYLTWLRGVLTGDLGRSLDSGTDVGTLLGGRLANSLALLVCALTVALALALALGVFAALRRGGPADRLVTSAAVSLQAVPGFVVAIALIILLATTVWPVFPAASLLEPGISPFAQPWYLVLPALTLVVAETPYLLRQVRSSVIDALESDYATAARLRGVPERRVIWRHALPNGLVPAVQATALTTSVLLGGSLVVEVAFSYPGLGGALNAAVGARDIPVIQAAALLLAGGVVVVNLVADLVTVLLTPRLRTGER